MFGMSSQLDSGLTPSQFTHSIPSDSSYASLSSAKSREAQPMIPVTVKQINEAVQSADDKSNFVINGADVSNVKLVGIVSNKSERITDVSFVLDDGTGRIECTRWVNDASDTKEVEGFLDGMYVRIHGHLKLYQSKKQVVAFAIRLISDYNEVASHFIECAYMHSRDCKVAPNGSTTISSDPPGNSSSNNNHFSFGGQYNMDGLKDIEKKVIDYLQQPSSLSQEKGVHRNEMAQQLKVPLDKILEAIDSLESEGLVYSTIDECHYKSTAS